MSQRPLYEFEQEYLDTMNKAVADAIAARTMWLDAKMVETSELKIGDDIYDIRSGKKLGVITGLYRYQARQNRLLDTSIYCDYEYQTEPGIIDNTSSQPGLEFGTREEAARWTEIRAERLKRLA